MTDNKKQPPVINPFSYATDVFKKIIENRRFRKEAGERQKEVLETYRRLVEDPRYQKIKEQTDVALGDQLILLVDEASKCTHGCAPYAARVRVLQEIVLEPLHVVWQEAHRSSAEMPDEAYGS